MTTEQKSRGGCWLHSRTGLVLIVFLAITAFFLITEHRAHLYGFLPFLLLLLCPLLHWLMHGGHANHGGDGGEKR